MSTTALPLEATLPPKITRPTVISSAAAAKDRPDAKREALIRMEPKWELPDLLLGGTKAFHDAGSQVLVREQDETDEEFARRMSRTALTDYYGETIARHSSRPFAREVVFDPPLPERLGYLESNADGCGRSFTVFLREVLYQGIHRGLCHVLVDIPPDSGDSRKSELDRKPIMNRIDAPCLLGVEESATDTGDHVTYARFRQTRTGKAGAFGEKSRDEIMVIAIEGPETGEVLTYEMQEDGGWLVSATKPYTIGGIPLFTFYAQQTGAYEGAPAYGRLAELNLLHFQSDADQRHALSYGRRATIVQTGWKSSTSPAEAVAKGGTPTAQKSALGYGRRLRHDNADAKAFLLETSGAPIAAGAEDIKQLEERIERFGAAQVSKGGGITATSRRIDNQSDTCNLEAWCTRVEHVALQALRAVAALAKVDLPAGQKVMIDRSFADDTPPSEDVPHIIAMARDRLLSLRTTYGELKARNVLLTVTDPDAEVAALAEEQASMAELDMERLAKQMVAQRPENQPATPPEAEDPDEDATA